MYKTRTRVVNFRITLDELDQLQSAARVSGALSMSDFARNATLRQARREPVEAAASGGSVIDSRLHSFESRIAGLETNLGRVLASLSDVLDGLGRGPGADPGTRTAAAKK
jgi:hypothetical protein